MRKYILALITLFSLPILSACQSAPTQSSQPPPEAALAADRSDVSHLRSEIPVEQRLQNDQTALVLETINRDGTFTEDPSKARERFGRLTREKRAASDKHFREKREAFTKAQKTKRDAFLKDLKERWASFMSKTKTTSVERNDFRVQQDKRRQTFFAEEANQRKAFESTLTDERRKYEDSVREATNKFNDAIREYTAEYHERQKRTAPPAKAEAHPEPAAATSMTERDRLLLEEFKQKPKGPAVQLKPSGR